MECGRFPTLFPSGTDGSTMRVSRPGEANGPCWRWARLLRAKPERPRRSHCVRGLEALEGRALLSLGFASMQGAARSALIGREHAEGDAPRRRSVPRGRAAGQEGPSVFGVRKVMSDVVYRQVGGHRVKLDVYAPVGPRPAEGWPAVLALPGGGWRWASKQDYGGAASALCRAGFVVVAVDYTYSDPGVRTWPTNLEDVREAVRWVRRNSTRIGVDPGKIAVMGESAGGHLAALAGTYPDGRVIAEGTPVDPIGQPTGGVSARVQAVVNFYGPGDLLTQYRDSPRDRPYMASFLGGTPDRVPGRYVAASAVSHVSPDDPPMLIFQGTRDAIVPMSQSVELDAALKAAGVPSRLVLLDGFSHGFRFDLGRGVSVLPEVVGFLNTALQVEPKSNRRV